MSTAPLSGIPRHEQPRPASQPEPDAATGGGGGSRLALMLSAVVAVIAIAGIVVVLTGDESTETTSEQTSAGTSAGSGSGTDNDLDSPVSSPDAAASTPSESPVEVAEAFFTAVESGDCEEIIARMTVESFSSDGETPEEAVAECEADEEGLAAIMSADFWSVELVSEDGDQAAVAVTLVTDDGEAVRELPLRLVDGEWKMDLDPSLAPSPS